MDIKFIEINLFSIILFVLEVPHGCLNVPQAWIRFFT